MADSSRREKLGGIAAAALFFLLPAWVFRHVLAGSKVLFTLDFLTYIEPKGALLRQAIADWRLPLWMPEIGCGVPFLAEIDNGVLNPWNALLAFGPSGSIEVGAPLWCGLAALAMFFFLREWQVARLSSAVGALAYGSSGLLVFYYDNPIYLNAAVYIPVLLLFYHRALARRCLPYLGLAGASVALMLLTGDAQTVYAAVALLLPYGFIVPGVRRPVAEPLFAYAAVGLLSVVLTLVQLLPALELVSQAPRELDLRTAHQASFHPGRMLETIAPFAYGMGLPGSPYRGQHLHTPDSPQPWTRSVYVGLLPIIFLPMAFLAGRRRRLALVLAGVGLLATVASFGPATPLYRWLYQVLPMFNSFRVPSKLWILTVFCLAALGAIGFDHFLGARRSRLPMLVAGILAVSGIGLALFGNGPGTGGPAAGAPAVQLIVVSTVSLVLLGIGRGRKAALTLLLLVHVADLAIANGQVARYFGDPATASVEPAGASAAILDDADAPPEGIRIFHDARLVDARGYRAPTGVSVRESRKIWDRLSLDWNHALVFGLQYLSGYTVLQDGRPFELRMAIREQRARSLPLLGRFGVAYEVLPGGADVPEGTTLVGDVAGGAIRVVRVDDRFPRLYLTRYGRAVEEPLQALGVLLHPDFDARAGTLLEVAETELPFPGVASPATVGEVTMVSYAPGRVVAEVDVPEPRYLVFGEAGYNGWHAYVDGAERPMYRANFMAQALAIRPGESRVELVYRPTSFVVGAWVSGLAWIVLIGGIGLASVRRRMERS